MAESKISVAVTLAVTDGDIMTATAALLMRNHMTTVLVLK